jgi:hypothetical protein
MRFVRAGQYHSIFTSSECPLAWVLGDGAQLFESVCDRRPPAAEYLGQGRDAQVTAADLIIFIGSERPARGLTRQ